MKLSFQGTPRIKKLVTILLKLPKDQKQVNIKPEGLYELKACISSFIFSLKQMVKLRHTCQQALHMINKPNSSLLMHV